MLGAPTRVTVAVHGVIGEPVYVKLPGEQSMVVVDPAGVTTWPPANEPLLDENINVPEYAADTEWALPGTSSVEVAQVAEPATTGTAVQAALPSMTKFIVPLLPTGGTDATFAVNVTRSPNTDGLSDDETVVVVATANTVWLPFAAFEQTVPPL